MTDRRFEALSAGAEENSAESQCLLTCNDGDETEIGARNNRTSHKQNSRRVNLLIACSVAFVATVVLLIVLVRSGVIVKHNGRIRMASISRIDARDIIIAGLQAVGSDGTVLEILDPVGLVPDTWDSISSSSGSSDPAHRDSMQRITGKCPVVEIPRDEPIPSSLLPYAPETSEYLSNVCIVELMGRLGNRLFQYFAAFRFAFENKLAVQLPYLEEDIEYFPALRRFSTRSRRNAISIKANRWQDEPRKSIAAGEAYTLDIKGFFQDPTRILAPYQRELVSVFSPARKFLDPLKSVYRTVLQHAGCAYSLVIAVHLRQGDLAEPECNNCPNAFRLPLSWYGEWINHLIHSDSQFLIKAKELQNKDCPAAPVSQTTYAKTLSVTAIMFTEFDNPDTSGLTRFGVQNTLSIKQVLQNAYGRTDCFPGLPSKYTNMYLDFWLLSQFRVMAASHSSFSLVAAMLSPHIYASDPQRDEAFFFSPNPTGLNITRFMPWDFHFVFDSFMPYRAQVIERKKALGDYPSKH